MGQGVVVEKSPYFQHACLHTSLASSIHSRWWHFCLQPSISSQGLTALDVKGEEKDLLGKEAQGKSRQMCCIGGVVFTLQAA